MTNPNNAVGTNGALGGRTSVNAFNDNLAIYASRGIVSGWTVSPSSNMTVSVGGVSGTRDVAIAADASGNKTTVNNISGQPISVTLAAAPSVNSRIDAIVAYVQNPATVSVTTLDNPSACGIISVSGTVASSPVQPTDSVIRAAITADGAAGATAYYVIISTIKIATGTTTITSSLISAGVNSTFNAGHFADGTVTSAALASSSVTNAKLAANSVSSDKVDWTTFKPYWKTVATSTSTSVTLPAGYRLYRVRLIGQKTNAGNWGVISCPQATGTTWIYIQGMSAGIWSTNDRSVTASLDKAVMDGARGGTETGFQTWDIAISKPDKNGALCLATWETGTSGSLTFNTGRSVFNVTNGTAVMNLYCELSSTLWSVEVLVEN